VISFEVSPERMSGRRLVKKRGTKGVKIKGSLFCAAIMLLTAALALAGDASGRWQGKLSVNGGEMPGYLVLKQDGHTLTGTAGPDSQKQVKLTKGLAEGDQVTIEAALGDAVLRFVLHLKDGKLTGEVFEDGARVGTAVFARVNE
jgi:hypothetical protein